ncbi:MAG: GNAT family N-acetyltransferase [Planctomycetota bacterium]
MSATPPPTDVNVRDAVADDLSFIFHANREMARETEDKELDPATLQSGIATALADPSLGFYLIAEIDGDDAGTLMVTREWSDWRNGLFWWIQSVYVLPRFRGRRAYSALHHAVVDRARDHGNIQGVRLYVDRENQHAREVYQRLGMDHSNYDMMEISIP